jgi:hypothetical protein
MSVPSFRISRCFLLGGSALAAALGFAAGAAAQTQLPKIRAGACSSAHALKGRPRLSKLKENRDDNREIH